MKYECFLPNSDSSAVRMINEEELDNVCSRRRHKRLPAGHKRLNVTIGRTHEMHILPTAKRTAPFNDGARLQ